MNNPQKLLSQKWLSPILMVLSLIYESLVLARLWAYQKGLLKSYRPKAAVISVGNITVGGSGKTPMVDFLVKSLKQQNFKTCILSRGYGRKTRSTIQRLLFSENIPANPYSFGDEPYLLALRHPEIPVYVGSSRILTAKISEEWDHPDVIVLDDAYQHLAIKRDLNLLLVDAERGLGNRYLLPRGELREPEHHWNRADAVILTKANLGFSDAIFHMLKKELNISCPIFKFNYLPKKLVRLDELASHEISSINEANIFLISAIAQPAGLMRVIEQQGGKIVDQKQFPDHHSYQQKDIDSILKEYGKTQTDYWITTEKDAVKLQHFPDLKDKLWILEMGVQPEREWDLFFQKFQERIQKESQIKKSNLKQQ